MLESIPPFVLGLEVEGLHPFNKIIILLAFHLSVAQLWFNSEMAIVKQLLNVYISCSVSFPNNFLSD
jgi:hypothetical protein